MDEDVDVDALFEEMKSEWLAAGGEAIIEAGNAIWNASK